MMMMMMMMMILMMNSLQDVESHHLQLLLSYMYRGQVSHLTIIIGSVIVIVIVHILHDHNNHPHHYHQG